VRFLSVVDRLLLTQAFRFVLITAFFAAAVLVALVFPDTPDEMLRIETAYAMKASGQYNLFFWPPGNVLTILGNPLLGSGHLSDVAVVRLGNLALTALPLAWLFWQIRDSLLALAVMVAAPYIFLVLSTGSQQGLMIGLFALLALAIARERLLLLGFVVLPLFLVNPAMLLVLPTALVLMTLLNRDPWCAKALLICFLSYLPILGVAVLIYRESGQFLPTLASNGPLNVFLGNNPHPLSHRGLGDLQATALLVGLSPDADHIAIVKAWIGTDPAGFASNLLTKMVLFWMPWDHFRSGIGGNAASLLFAYVFVAQVVIYAVFVLTVRRGMDKRLLIFTVLMCLGAWALYTLFFVKIRFRIPFDILLLLSCIVAVLPRRERGYPNV
jgi:hypothetical protein